MHTVAIRGFALAARLRFCDCRGDKVRKLTCCFAASLIVQAVPDACAQVSPDKINASTAVSEYFEELPVVLSASRLRQSINQAPSAVTVIDRDMIVASGARRIEEILRLIPGFHVGYTAGGSPIVAYHGLSDAYARRMQVLIDGVSIYSPLYGGVDWTELPLALQDIERIEIVRGPNAVTYGANAFFSVINIITRDPATVPRFQLDSNIGGNGIRDVAARLAGQGEDGRYRLTLGQRYDDGFAFLPDSSTVHFASLRAHFRFNPTDELGLQMRTSHSTEGQGFYNRAIDDSSVSRPRHLQHSTMQARWTRAQSVDDESWLQLYHHSHSFRETASVYILLPSLPPIPYSFGFNYNLTRDDIEFQQSRKHTDALRLVWGAQWRTDSVRSQSFFHSDRWLDNRLIRLFANAEWRPGDKLAMHGGAMLEHNSLTGSAVSPRLAATYVVRPGHTLRAAVSRANRSPTLFEEFVNQRYDAPPALASLARGVPLKVTYLASGGLGDERILSREIAYVGEFPDLKLSGDVRYFRDRIDSLIHPTLSRPVTAIFNKRAADYSNSGLGVHQRGYEVGARWRPWSGAQIDASVGQIRIDSDMPDTEQSAPSHTRSLLFRQALPVEMSFSAAYFKIDSMRWQSSPSDVPEYETLDVRMATPLRWGGQRGELALVTRNALGAYRDYNQNNFQRRISYLQLSLAY